jgi:hypothetical protein
MHQTKSPFVYSLCCTTHILLPASCAIKFNFFDCNRVYHIVYFGWLCHAVDALHLFSLRVLGFSRLRMNNTVFDDLSQSILEFFWKLFHPEFLSQVILSFQDIRMAIINLLNQINVNINESNYRISHESVTSQFVDINTMNSWYFKRPYTLSGFFYWNKFLIYNRSLKWGHFIDQIIVYSIET